MKILCILIVSFVSASFCNAENILLSAATTDKELVLLKIQYANKKFTVMDGAIFKLPFQAGLTALGRSQNGNYEVFWTAQDASKKIKLHSMIFDANLNKVGNIKKFPQVLSSHFNLSLVDQDQPSLKPGNSNLPPSGSKIVFDSEGNPYIANYNYNGRQIGVLQKLFTRPPSVQVIDTSLTGDGLGSFFYHSLFFDSNIRRYGVFFGNTSNAQFTTAYAFTGSVITAQIVSDPGTDNFDFIFGELKNNNVQIKAREFNGLTGQPNGPIRIHVTSTGNLGQLAFFNMFTSVSSEDVTTPNLRYTLFTRLDQDGIGTPLWAYTWNAATESRTFMPVITDFRNFTSYRPMMVLYGLDAEADLGL